MITRKMMVLAAVPVAALAAGGGVAAAHAAGGSPGTAVVQQATVRHHGDACHRHHVTPGAPVMRVTARHGGDHGTCDDHGRRGQEHTGYGQRVGAGARGHCPNDRGADGHGAASHRAE